MSNIYCNKKIPIAFVVWTLEGMGGSETIVYEIVKKLNKKIFDIVVIGFREGQVRSIYEKLGVKVAVVEKKGKFDLQFIFSLRKIFIDNDIQLINAHHFSPLLYAFLATRMTGVKIIYTEHSVWQIQEMNIFYKNILKYIVKRIDAIIAISLQLVKFYDKKIEYKDKVHLIINGIDLSRYKMNKYSIRKELGFDSKDKLIGMIANLRPEKNHKLLISSFSQLTKRISNCHLLLVGLDCMNGDVQRYAADSGCSDKIHFLGAREDVVDILNSLDVFCLPSVHEGLPLTVLEALACGVPVIGSNVMGINEVIAHNENGLLFDSGDEKMLLEKLAMMFQDDTLRSKLKKNGMEYVRRNYNLDNKIKEYESLFVRLCGQELV